MQEKNYTKIWSVIHCKKKTLNNSAHKEAEMS